MHLYTVRFQCLSLPGRTRVARCTWRVSRRYTVETSSALGFHHVSSLRTIQSEHELFLFWNSMAIRRASWCWVCRTTTFTAKLSVGAWHNIALFYH